MKTAIIFFALCGIALCVPKCRDGWYLGNEEKSCYKAHNFQTSWAEAFIYCTVMRAQLADITTREEQESVAKILGTHYNESYPQFWIDLTDLSTEGDWRLMSDNQETEFMPWIAGQPNNWQGRENCAHINAKSFRHFMWNDHNCQAQLNFLCEAYPEDDSQTKDDGQTTADDEYAQYYHDYFSSLYE